MVCKLYHKQNPRLDKRFHPVDIPSEKGCPSRMCPGPIIIHYLHKYSWTEISNSNFNFYTDTFIYCTAPKQQLWCLVWTPPSPPSCEAGLWLTESLSSSVAVVDWLKRLNPSLSFASDSYKPQSVQMMEFPVTKWDLPHGYQADFAPRSCSCSSGKSIKKSPVTWVCSELQVQPRQPNSQNAQIKRHSGWFCWGTNCFNGLSSEREMWKRLPCNFMFPASWCSNRFFFPNSLILILLGAWTAK